jgi:tripartite-type tricarboxylate transporter receptor subunit TctC
MGTRLERWFARLRAGAFASLLRRVGAALILCLAAGAGAADTYPSRPLRMVVPFTPGGATDVLARMTGDALGKRLGQTVIIENRPGAGANIGARIAAKAPADGYTLLMAPTSIYAIAMTLYKSPGFDVTKDFVPVSSLANALHVLVVNPDLHANTLKELLVLARRNPDGLTVASQGIGTVSHLEAVMLQQMTGIQMVHVPYKGSAPAVLDLLAGRVQVMFDSVASTLPHIRADKLRPIGVPTPQRVSVLPDVPTLDESGLTGYRAESWLAIMVPAATPRPIVARLNRELVAILADEQMRRALAERGFQPQSSTPDELAQRLREEIVAWGKVVKASGASVE